MKKKLVIVEAIAIVLLIGLVFFWFFGVKRTKIEDTPMDVSDYKPVITDMATSPEEGVQGGESSAHESLESIDYLAEIRAVNEDAVAWLTLPDTHIDYPILRAEDNKFYMSKNLLKEYNRAGNPFLDYRCEKDFSGFNSIIYGHNMASRQMFADLEKFKNQRFFDEHPKGTFITSSKVYDYNVVACLLLKNDDFIYDAVFVSKEQKERFLSDLKKNAKYYREPARDVDLLEQGLVTLSTCSYEFTDARTVLVGYLTIVQGE